jgi:type IX secretion system PorP/SprF family membrane protein
MVARMCIFFFVVIVPLPGYGQGASFDLYQYNYLTINPAFAGTEGTKLTELDNVVFPVKNNPHSFFVAAETRLQNVGVGLTGFRTSLGAETIAEIAAPVNYQFKVNKSKLVAGARLSYQLMTVDFSKITWLDQSDPLLNASSKDSRSIMNLGLGALYDAESFFAGISVDNLLGQEKANGNTIPPPPTRYNVMLGKTFNGKGKFTSTHSIYATGTHAYYTSVKDSWRVDLNNSIVFIDRWIAGVTLELDKGGDVLPKFNAGVNFANIAKVVVLLYSKKGDIQYKGFNGQLALVFMLPPFRSM